MGEVITVDYGGRNPVLAVVDIENDRMVRVREKLKEYNWEELVEIARKGLCDEAVDVLMQE
jgi:hypothetical protein